MRWIILSLLLLTPSLVDAQEYAPATGQELIKSAAAVEGRKVAFTGEVVGDIMIRSHGAWLNLMDDQGFVIGVLAPPELISAIAYKGNYRHQGDIVEVRGTFFRADKKQLGELYIKADGIQVITPGHKKQSPLNILKVEAVAVLGIIAMIVGGLKMYIRRRQRALGGKG